MYKILCFELGWSTLRLIFILLKEGVFGGIMYVMYPTKD